MDLLDMSLDEIIAAEKKSNPNKRSFNRYESERNSELNDSGFVEDRSRNTSRYEDFSNSEANRSRYHFDTKCGQISVLNLKYEVNDDDLKLLFQKFGKLKRAAVNYLIDGKSAGTGLVVFEVKSDAQKAYKAINGLLLDGRDIRLKLLNTYDRCDQNTPRRRPHISEPSGSQTRGQMWSEMAETFDVENEVDKLGEIRQFRGKRFKVNEQN